MDIQKDLVTLLGVFFAALGGLLATIYMILKRRTDLPIKIIGSFLVLGVCFLAKNGFVYALGVFIIATLVTELEFLEKLAALAWGRKEYWDYLGRKASNSEIREKLKEEFNEENNFSKTKIEIRDQGKFVDYALRYENEALEHLSSPGGIFPKHHLKKQVAIVGGAKRFILDAIADGPKYYYLIEVKATNTKWGLSKALEQLKAYQSYLIENKILTNTRLLIIAPNFPECPDNMGEAYILKYDAKLKVFVNRDLINRWIFEEYNR